LDPADFDRLYEVLRPKLVRFFDHRGCLDPYDLADETVVRLVAAMARREIRDFNGFAFGVARHVYFDWLEQKGKANLQTDTTPAPPPRNTSQRAICLQRCLRLWPAQKRELIEAYFVDGNRIDLAKRSGLGANALRIRIFHLKQKLRTCVDLCVEGASAR
jgi:DNA-directed RNA polymerase specialized sigma24 family protein